MRLLAIEMCCVFVRPCVCACVWSYFLKNPKSPKLEVNVGKRNFSVSEKSELCYSYVKFSDTPCERKLKKRQVRDLPSTVTFLSVWYVFHSSLSLHFVLSPAFLADSFPVVQVFSGVATVAVHLPIGGHYVYRLVASVKHSPCSG